MAATNTNTQLPCNAKGRRTTVGLGNCISFLVISSHWVVAGRTARYQRIALCARRTGTDGKMALRLALSTWENGEQKNKGLEPCGKHTSIPQTGKRTNSALSTARIDTLVRDASLMISTFCITLAFALYAKSGVEKKLVTFSSTTNAYR